MKRQNNIYRIITPGVFVLLLIAGCQSSVGLTATPTILTATPSRTATSSPIQPIFTPTRAITSSPMIIPFPLPTIATSPTQPPPTWTPLPTLSLKEAQLLVQDLLQSNAGCRLPCWWRVRPGQTTWQEAQNFLATFTLRDVYTVQASDGASFTGWFVFPYENENKTVTIDQGYIVQNGIVEAIEINFGYVTFHTLSALLHAYGPPSEVWIRTFGTEYQGTIPFYLIVFYPNTGIMALYDSNDAELKGDMVQKCFDQDTVHELALWSPERALTFDEARGLTVGIKFDDPFPLYSLEKATDLDIDTFYEVFTESNSPACLETPAGLWPGQYQ